MELSTNDTPKRVKVLGSLFSGKVPPGAVYIGRSFVGLPQSPFANPWCVKHSSKLGWELQQAHPGEWVVSHHRWAARIVGGFPDRAAAQHQAVLMYRAHIDQLPNLRERAIAELRGKDLACWCQPDQACHGDYLLDLANMPGVS